MIYVADHAENGGIYAYEFKNGRLFEKQKVTLSRPMYLCISERKLYCILRTVTQSGESGIVSFDIMPDGTLENMSDAISTDGEVACHLCVKDGAVYSTNYISGSVNKLSKKTVVHEGEGTNKPRQDKAHTHFVNVSPDGKYLLVCDLGLDKVFCYDTELDLVSETSIPASHGVRHLAYDGNTVYSVNELASTVTVFDYADGRLSPLATVNALPDSFEGKNTAAAIKICGKLLYVSHRGYDGICIFDISEKLPRLVGSFKSGGRSPRDFELVGEHIIVTNEGGELAVFDKMGTVLLQSIKLESPLCVICG